MFISPGKYSWAGAKFLEPLRTEIDLIAGLDQEQGLEAINRDPDRTLGLEEIDESDLWSKKELRII